MQSWDAMLKHWLETALVTGVVLVTTMLAVYGPQFIWQAVKLAEQDSQQSTAMSTASKVAKDKERHPEKFCPIDRCLWKNGTGNLCPRHRCGDGKNGGGRTCFLILGHAGRHAFECGR